MHNPIILSPKHSILLLLLLIATTGHAQQDCLDTYDREAIYLRAELFAGTVFIKNGASHSVGFAYRRLRPEFEQTPHALPVLKKAQRLSRAQFWVSLAGIAGTGAGAFMVLQSIDSQGYLSNEKRYRNGLNLMLGSLAVSTAISLPLQIKSRQQLDDAIWLRNRELFGR
ncbi:MAG: hypothetical protein J0M29_04510 [Chitinophagales bacterium]|nr:hypothetical protein [Chitinophagales bacterium]